MMNHELFKSSMYGDESVVMQEAVPGRIWYRARTLGALGAALADIRRTAGLNQTRAAEATRSSRPTLSRMERGLPVATDVVVELLANTGYEILLVPRGSTVTIVTPEAQP